eukprot:5173355-Alexandrium_andersonii.AAC.1
MSASLVGSEMCIRDSTHAALTFRPMLQCQTLQYPPSCGALLHGVACVRGVQASARAALL